MTFLEITLDGIALLLPWVILAATGKFARGKHRVDFAIASMVLIYAALMLQVHSVNVRLEKELYAFDLNGDGVFSGSEITPAQESAMAAVVNDTGRAMAPITGAIFSVLYTSMCFLIASLASWLRARYRTKRT